MEGWLARDKSGDLWFYLYEPYKSAAGFWKSVEDEPLGSLVDECEVSKNIKWEDNRATHVKVNFEIL